MLQMFPIVAVAIVLGMLAGCGSAVTSDEYYQQRSSDAMYYNLRESIKATAGGGAPNYVPISIN